MISKVYRIGKIRQLVDLNGDITNFKCNFEIQSSSPSSKGAPLQIVVVNQTILDSGNPIEYQNVLSKMVIYRVIQVIIMVFTKIIF